MRTKTVPTLCLTIMGASLISIVSTEVSASPSAPEGGFYNTWQNLYPNSMSGQNVVSGTGNSCRLCHATGPGNNFNGYGWRIRQLINAGSSTANAILLAEPDDSDVDPTGTSNLGEIDADTQPGWTVGPNNTFYFSNGSTSQNEMPPAGILGDLDPAGAFTNYCTSTVNSTGAASTISATGSASISANDLVLTADNLPSQPGIFIAGPTAAQIPFFNGFLCIDPNGLQRFVNVANPSGGVVTEAVDLATAAAGGINAVSGSSYFYQRWNRDPAGGGGNANFSDGLDVLYTP